MTALTRLLGMLAAAALVIDAAVHATSSSAYDPPHGGVITEGNLFRAEAFAAAVVALLLTLSPNRLTGTLAFAVSVTALGAVILYRYVNVGAIGPLPDLYEPTWQVPGKLLSAYAEASAVLLSGAVLVVNRRRLRTHAEPYSATLQENQT